MRRLMILTFLILITGSLTAHERKIPFQADPLIDEIDVVTNSQLNLFDNPGFQRAALYSSGDSLYTVLITYFIEKEECIERKTLTSTELTEIRAKLLSLSPDALKRVFFCENPEIDFIDRHMNDRLNLIPYDPYFHEAKLYLGPNGVYYLEVFREYDGRITSSKRIFTTEERQNIKEILSRKGAAIDTEEEDRARSFYLWRSGYYSFFVIPWGVGIATESAELGFSAGLVAGAVHFITDYTLTNRLKISMGTATLATHGFTGGLMTGCFVASLADMEADSWALTATLGGIAGHHLGRTIGRRTQISEGMALAMANLGEIGGGVGLITGLCASDETDDDDPQRKLPAVFGLAGQYGYYLLGARMLKSETTTPGDAKGLATSATLGPILCSMLISGKPDVESEDYIPFLLAGSAIGLTDGIITANTYDFTRSQGTALYLLTAAGFLLGGGIFSEAEDDVYNYAVAGTALVVNRFARMLIIRNNLWKDSLIKFSDNVSVDSSGLLAKAALGQPYEGPLVSLKWRF